MTDLSPSAFLSSDGSLVVHLRVFLRDVGAERECCAHLRRNGAVSLWMGQRPVDFGLWKDGAIVVSDDFHDKHMTREHLAELSTRAAVAVQSPLIHPFFEDA